MSHYSSLSFANDGWQVLSVALIFLFGAYIALAQYRIFRVPQRLALGLYVWHTLFSIFYLVYSLSNSADAVSYYRDSLTVSGLPGLGTSAITYLTAILSRGLMLSYGGAFLVFNIFGFIGLMAFASVLHTMTYDRGKNIRRIVLITLLLPGASFWSAAIGKDALTFMASGLACWAAVSVNKRYITMIIAVLVMLVARPHIAAVLLMAISATMVISGQGRLITRVLLTVAAIPAAIYAVISAQAYVGLSGSLSSGAVANYIAQRQEYNTEGGLGLDIANMSIPVRMFSYVFRPLFLDGGGALGLVVSVENLILLLIAIATVRACLKKRKTMLPKFTWWFMLLFVLISLLILSNTTANLGIAMRQKWMFLPMFLLVCFSYLGRPSPHVYRRTL